MASHASSLGPYASVVPLTPSAAPSLPQKPLPEVAERSATSNGRPAPPGSPDTEMTAPGAMLPTPPASLPTLAGRLDVRTAPHGVEETQERDSAESSAESESADREGGEGGRGNTPPFAFDGVGGEGDLGRARTGDEGDVGMSDETTALAVTSLAQPPTPPSGPFSTSAPITRSFRARYASSSTDSLPLAESDAVPHAAHKRSHSNVSPSTGLTPPASYDFDTNVGMFSPPSLSLDLTLPRDEPRDGDAWLRRAEEGTAEPTRRPSLAKRWRSSFSHDQDRAQPTTSTSAVSATAPATSAHAGRFSSTSLLRRRTRPTTSTEAPPIAALPASAPTLQLDRERGGSKRRRSSTLLSEDSLDNRRSIRIAPWLGSSSASANSTSRAPVEPVLSRSNSSNVESSGHSDFRTIGRRARLSLNWLGNSASREEQQPPFAALHDAALPSPPSASREVFPLVRAPTFTRPFASPSTHLDSTSASSVDLLEHSSRMTLHARRSSDLSTRGEGLLREAAGVLRRAEETFGRASREVRRTEESRERDRERLVAQRLPSVGGLPMPEEASGGRPVVGVRLGEGWLPRPSHATASTFEAPQSPPSSQPPPVRRRRFSFSSPLTSSNPSNQEPQSPDGASTSSSSASSRARQFITQLRARRPRLSRNSTAVSPPEDGPAGDSRLSLARTESSTTTLRSWTLPSPPLVSGLVGSSFDEDFEAAEAARLNRHLLERRRVVQDLDMRPTAPLASPPHEPTSQAQPAGSLWGEPGSPQASSHRGFPRLRGPTERANERWRRGEQPISTSSITTATMSATAPFLSPWRRQSSVAPTTPAVTTVRPSPPPLDDGISRGNADAFFRRRGESPSPRSRRMRNDIDGMMSTRALNAAEEGAAGESTTSARFARPLGRPAFRLPQPNSSRSSSRPRVFFDEPDEAPPSDWLAAPMGPFMLPSGSEGRRMVFPHPANPAGPSERSETSYARDERLASESMGRQRVRLAMKNLLASRHGRVLACLGTNRCRGAHPALASTRLATSLRLPPPTNPPKLQPLLPTSDTRTSASRLDVPPSPTPSLTSGLVPAPTALLAPPCRVTPSCAGDMPAPARSQMPSIPLFRLDRQGRKRSKTVSRSTARAASSASKPFAASATPCAPCSAVLRLPTRRQQGGPRLRMNLPARLARQVGGAPAWPTSCVALEDAASSRSLTTTLRRSGAATRRRSTRETTLTTTSSTPRTKP
ncbi:hypothetical protein AAT19DRAFT_9526 [Rhodotorula toruloides]|uniref:Uncharacterized protein n=1 Tax=Rhodotorula toruloides TaxID=5286 RepID=A0A2T0A2E8_RHOTO|nr:hypothetical protein AAT19DRAFT_9526 [Rhodotorula toruloides]